METIEAVKGELPPALTPLELDLLTQFHARYNDFGFPHPSQMRVVSRQNTGAGRFTHLKHEATVQTPDGQLGLGKFSQFDMAGLEAGASFWIEVKHAKVACLEIIVNGEQEWDGSERPWVLVDPDTGDLSAARNAV